ncbi:MAG: 50S ribosomal protein L10 [Anaerolineae bacterium]
MAITKQKKEALIAQYAKTLERSSALFFTNYQGLTVNQMTALRRTLREANGSYTIVKNTLAKKVLREAGMTNFESFFDGPVGIGFSFEDPPPVAKALVEFSKGAEQLQIKGGLLGDVLLDDRAVKNLAGLPPLEVIRAQLLGIISAPASQLAGVVAGGVRQVINVVNAYAESGDGEAVPA